jgi:transcriptional regulator with XRE-family HTH domain
MRYASEDLLARLREERERRGITQRGLSQRSGISQSHISQIESGKLEPGLSSFLALARALDLEPVLAPRKLLPAVTGVLRAHAPRSPGPDEATRKSIEKILRALERKRAETGETETLDRLTMSLVTLRFAGLAPDELDQMRTALALLESQKRVLPDHLLKTAESILWPLRNKIAHAETGAARPAYALSEDERDA